tara:strand:- start:2478 stop:2675 length:198 start_codon:yes stop_codon:yes gene_type:complete
MLTLVTVALLGFALPLDPWRAEPPLPRKPLQRLKRVHRSPFTEHERETRVLCNLSKSEHEPCIFF